MINVFSVVNKLKNGYYGVGVIEIFKLFKFNEKQ